jgi:Domain of unknown function (DUF4338)
MLLTKQLTLEISCGQIHPMKKVAAQVVREANKSNYDKNIILLPSSRLKLEAQLRKSIVAATSKFNSELAQGNKNYLRALHLQAKLDSPGLNMAKALSLFSKHKKRFREGHEIDPSKISPKLHLVEDDEWAELFVTTRALWSMPYNKGYGRRLRFVIYDEYHDGVIGIIGLQSPPADLGVRDRLFQYPDESKLSLVNCTMDAYAVGAIPPYSYLLGGKLCAGLISSNTIRQAYWRRYAGQKSQMLEENIQQPLVAITTTSAFGRSSQYNRLKYHDKLLAEPIGYTLGFGTLHLEHLYGDISNYLKLINQYTKGGFGNGPKVRWQNISRALSSLGLSVSHLKHGVKREVFLYRLVENLEDGMSGLAFGNPIQIQEEDFSEFWLNRWALPRAERFPTWRLGNERELLTQTIKNQM